jgi:hypothetical protein
MNKILFSLSFFLLCTFYGCKKEIDKTSVFEGTYKAPTSYPNYDRVVVTRVNHTSFSIQYTLGSSAPFLIIPTATLANDSAFSFDVVASFKQNTDKYLVRGEGKIFPNRIVVIGKGVNKTNDYDFYLIDFEGFRRP